MDENFDISITTALVSGYLVNIMGGNEKYNSLDVYNYVSKYDEKSIINTIYLDGDCRLCIEYYGGDKYYLRLKDGNTLIKEYVNDTFCEVEGNIYHNVNQIQIAEIVDIIYNKFHQL